jgi:hypothetical protein
VINMPILLAVKAANNETDIWFKNTNHIHLLRTHRAFDIDWFDEAYNRIIASCLADGIIP